MKKKLLISLLAAVCVLSLTACAKTPEQATESKEDTAVSQPSEVTPSDTKIEVPPASKSKALNPLTLEQVKDVIFFMTESRDPKIGVGNIVVELDKIQQSRFAHDEYLERGVWISTHTYRLFENGEQTNNTIVVKNTIMHLQVIFSTISMTVTVSF